MADADLAQPAAVLNDPIITDHLDFTEPVALFQISTLHHLADAQDPRKVMQTYIDALPSGSFVAITHFFDPEDGDALSALARRLENIMVSGPMGSGWFRTRDAIEEMFCGLELISPGLDLLPNWWPDGPPPQKLHDVQRLLLGGLARKP